MTETGRVSSRQVADLVCSTCGWHVVVWRTEGSFFYKVPNFHGPADLLFQHVEAEHGDAT